MCGPLSIALVTAHAGNRVLRSDIDELLRRFDRVVLSSKPPGQQQVNFGQTKRGQTYEQAFKDKASVRSLKAKNAPMSKERSNFLHYVKARLDEMQAACGVLSGDSSAPAAAEPPGQSNGELSPSTAEQKAPNSVEERLARVEHSVAALLEGFK